METDCLKERRRWRLDAGVTTCSCNCGRCCAGPAGTGNDTLLIFSTGLIKRQRSVRIKPSVAADVSSSSSNPACLSPVWKWAVGVTFCAASQRLVMQLLGMVYVTHVRRLHDHPHQSSGCRILVSNICEIYQLRYFHYIHIDLPYVLIIEQILDFWRSVQRCYCVVLLRLATKFVSSNIQCAYFWTCWLDQLLLYIFIFFLSSVI